MGIPNDFSEYYKTISNTELLNILENSADYQSEAIEAAKKEFSNRQLSDVEIDKAKEPILVKRLQKEKQLEKIKIIENKVKTTGFTLLDTLNPIQSGIQTSEKIIRFIVVLFGLSFLYQVIKDYYLIIVTVKEIPLHPTEGLIYLIPLLILLIAVITFWKKKTIGWLLLTIFLTFSFVAEVWILIHAILWRPTGNAFIDNFSSHPPVISEVLQLSALVGILNKTARQPTLV